VLSGRVLCSGGMRYLHLVSIVKMDRVLILTKHKDVAVVARAARYAVG
jgi:hypothetical protein